MKISLLLKAINPKQWANAWKIATKTPWSWTKGVFVLAMVSLLGYMFSVPGLADHIPTIIDLVMQFVEEMALTEASP